MMKSLITTSTGSDYESSFQDAVDIVTVMMQQERSTYLRRNCSSTRDTHTADSSTSSSSTHGIVDGVWRQRIVEWMFGVVDHCSLRRDSVAVAAYYLDLIVERGIITSRRDYQLAAMTSLQLAIKLYDSTVVKLDSMIKLGRGMFVEEDIVAMELKILHALRWNVHPPTTICFIRQFLKLLPSSVTSVTRYMITEVTRFISEISVCLHKFVDYPPSAVAYAGMVMAIDQIDYCQLPIWQRHQILLTFANTLNLHRDSAQIREVITLLQQSLKSNVSLQDLIATIDRQCRSAPALNTSYPKLENYNNFTNTVACTGEALGLNTKDDSVVSSAMTKSPRDVVL